MVIHTDQKGRQCGDVKVEDQNKKLQDQYFILDINDGKLLIYHDRPENLPKTACYPCNEIDLNFISKVSDARKLRQQKAGNWFCITNAGDQLFVKTDTETELTLWIEALNQACRITIPLTESPTCVPQNTRNEVAGGVLVSTEVSDDDDIQDQKLTALSQASYISGYATKQGAVRKNWKKRYFVLSESGLSYYKNDQDRESIKTIPLQEINEARLVSGQHHPHRQNLFEVVTCDRIFNIQCENAKISEEWIDQINKHTKKVDNPLQVSSSSESYSKPNVQSVQGRPSSQEEVKPSRAVWV